METIVTENEMATRAGGLGRVFPLPFGANKLSSHSLIVFFYSTPPTPPSNHSTFSVWFQIFILMFTFKHIGKMTSKKANNFDISLAK